jgi:hypothetical protein
LVAVTWWGSEAPVLGQWTVAVYGGGVHTHRSDLTIRQPDAATDVRFRDVEFASQSLDSPVYYGYRVGRALRRRLLFLEGEFIHAKAYARLDRRPTGTGTLRGQRVEGARIGDLVQHFAISHGLNFILANVVVRKPLAATRLGLVARAGLGPMRPHGETELDGRRLENYEWAGVGAQVAAGVELRLWRGLHGLLEYKLTSARPRIAVYAGEARVSTLSHHFAVGATWFLGH